MRVPGVCAVAFVRSEVASARIARIDAARARRGRGVIAVVTAADLGDSVKPLAPRLEGPGFRPTAWPPLAGARVSFSGQAVAAVVATSPSLAADARDAVQIAYAPESAQADVLFQRAFAWGDVDAALRSAAVVVTQTFRHARCAAVPIEPRGILVRPTPEGGLEVWASTQAPHRLRDTLATLLDVEPERVRVIVPDVGGGFGLKLHVFPEDLVVAAIARLIGRPVKWVEERRESFAAGAHAREQVVDIEAAATAEGRLLGVRARLMSDGGAFHIYPLTQALEPLGTASILPGPYRLPAYAYSITVTTSPKPPIGAYRGVGMTMGAFVMERVLDLLAERLALDPAEIRRRNLLARDAYPCTSASGLAYDSGDFPGALEQALSTAGYAELRQEQQRARAAGRLVGIGLACYTEYTGLGSEVYRQRGMPEVVGHEGVALTLEADGRVRCAPSSPSQGQGHATALTQLVADALGVSPKHITIAPVDTSLAPSGGGTFASRGAVAFAGSVAAAAEIFKRKVLDLAAGLLEASVDDLRLEGGVVRVRGVPGRAVTLARIAQVAPGLQAAVQYEPPGPAYAGGVHLAVVEVDPDTGRVTVVTYVVVEDCGAVINPLIVEGQIHGAVAQGIGEALWEALVYDDAGQLLTGTLMDYAVPAASSLPAVAISHRETRSPLTVGGVKGMGEGGTIGAPAAVANAVADAVRARGVTITALPIEPWELIGAPPRPQRGDCQRHQARMARGDSACSGDSAGNLATIPEERP